MSVGRDEVPVGGRKVDPVDRGDLDHDLRLRPAGLDQYLTWMEKQGDTPNEYTTYGWINAAMLDEGLKAERARTSRRPRSSRR